MLCQERNRWFATVPARWLGTNRIPANRGLVLSQGASGVETGRSLLAKLRFGMHLFWPNLERKGKNSKHRQVALMRPFIPGVFLLSAAVLTAQTQSSPQIGYKSAADAEQKKTLLLRDFKPASMLHVPVHPVEKAKFYVIDVHNHINDAARIDDHMPPERVLEVMK